MQRELLQLESLNGDYVADFCRWIRNKEAVKFSLSCFGPPRTEEWVRNYIASLNSSEDSWDQAIVFDDAKVGFCGLCNISNLNRSAEFYILIGDSGYWGKGIGTEAGRKVLEYGFKELNLHRIWLTVSEVNSSAVRLYEKLGFIREGVMRDAKFLHGHYHNKLVMGVLCS